MHGRGEQEKQASIAAGERELGAFMTAVRRIGGAAAGRRAAEYWVEALEQLSAPAKFDWRRITIAAASRLAKETIPGKPGETTVAVAG